MVIYYPIKYCCANYHQGKTMLRKTEGGLHLKLTVSTVIAYKPFA